QTAPCCVARLAGCPTLSRLAPCLTRFSRDFACWQRVRDPFHQGLCAYDFLKVSPGHHTRGTHAEVEIIARLLELRSHTRADGRFGAPRRHRPHIPQPPGRGDLLPHAAAPRIRCGRDVALLVPGLDVPRAAAVHCDSCLSVEVLPPFLHLYQH